MRLEARPVLPEHHAILIALTVAGSQADLVTPNARTLEEQFEESGSQVWGLWVGDIAVGLMAMVNPRTADPPHPEDDPEAAYLWRLMIGAAHQGKGYGKAAIALAKAQARAWGFAKLTSGVRDVAHSNLGFYLKQGFQVTERVVSGDRVIYLTLSEAPD
jgi:diamine N-acetyltransferase